MSEEKKEYDNEMRGTLWKETERVNDKAPVLTGTITVSGVELRIAVWPGRVAGGNGKGAGKQYFPCKVEYKQGTKFMLAKVNPANVVVTGAAGAADAPDASAPGEGAAVPVDDMPF